MYNGQPVVDISRRVVVANTTLTNPFIFYPYTISNERSDQLARKVYGDPYQEWILFLTNNIVDPYDSWYMNQNEFNDFLIQKYGSIQITQQKIKNYTNNWYNNLNTLGVDAYDALSIDEIKYWQPNYDSFGIISSYSRLQADWTINTNYLVNFNYTNTIPQFINDELVTINYTANNVGYGQVGMSANNTLTIRHVSGHFLPNGAVNTATFSITGSESNSIFTISNSNNLTINSYNSVSNDEIVYYDPVYIYDYENAKNESNKFLNIMLPQYAQELSSNLSSVLNK